MICHGGFALGCNGRKSLVGGYTDSDRSKNTGPAHFFGTYTASVAS